MTHDAPIAEMDATCPLCSWGALLIHCLDRTGDVRIAPIQGKVWRDLDAAIRLGERVEGMGRVCSALRMLPRPLRAWLYVRVARNRYALFGRGDMCDLYDPSFQARFLP